MQMRRSFKTEQGFTLIELIFVLVCIALLSSWAWPNYQALMMRSHRTSAQAALLQAAHWLERAASANGTYPKPSEIPASVLQTDGQRYTLSADTAAQSYTLTATPVGWQVGDVCGRLTLNHLGVRGAQGGNPNAWQCWSR